MNQQMVFDFGKLCKEDVDIVACSFPRLQPELTLTDRLMLGVGVVCAAIGGAITLVTIVGGVFALISMVV